MDSAERMESVDGWTGLSGSFSGLCLRFVNTPKFALRLGQPARIQILALLVGGAVGAISCGRQPQAENPSATPRTPPSVPTASQTPAATSPTPAAATSTENSTTGTRPTPTPRAGGGLRQIPQELLEAAMEGREELVDRALREGLVDVNAVGPEGRTLLMMAAFNGHAALCRRLIGYGAAVNQRDASGRTALMYAASGPNVDAVRVLLEAGADVNAVDGGERWTALMFAAAEGQPDVVRVLLQYGANPDLRDADQDRAVDFARRNGHTAVVELLERAPAP